MQNRFAHCASIVAGLAAATTLAGSANAAEVQIAAAGPVVELSVYETVDIEPDIATISAGVTTDAQTAVAAMRDNSAQMRKVVDRIKALGIAERDIQTSGINLSARYDFDRTSQNQVFRGYQASNRVTVKLRDIERTGAVLDALVAAGANDLGGPNFMRDDDTDAKAQARSRAMDRAREQALEYARMSGYSGLKLLQVSEAMANRGPMPQAAMRAVAMDAVAESAPVQPGMISTGVNVTVTYELTGGS